VVQRTSIDRLVRDIEASGLRDVLLAELAVARADRGGMQASGLIIVNPPWTLAPQLQVLLAFLATTLGLQGQGSYRLETLVAE
jgi:23S rRNA (adenine2030-N6)-methyltransferase